MVYWRTNVYYVNFLFLYYIINLDRFHVVLHVNENDVASGDPWKKIDVYFTFEFRNCLEFLSLPRVP